MKDNEIQIGDVLRIRQYDDMLKECMDDETGRLIHPDSDVCFTQPMKKLCGLTFTVDTKYLYSACGEMCYTSNERVEQKIDKTQRETNWLICAWMLEPARDKKFHKPSNIELSSLFFA